MSKSFVTAVWYDSRVVSMFIMQSQSQCLHVEGVETLSWMGFILPQEVDKSTLSGYGCLYTVGKLYGILTLLLE